MKIPLGWLREFVPIDLDTPALCERLSLGGLVVDAVEEIGADIRGVVVGEIVAAKPHPHAERLTLCEVRFGAPETVTVVCGATNMQPGDRIAYAPPGTTLPGGRRIEAAIIRGVTSAGMLCSEAELGLTATSDGILILASDAVLGRRVGVQLGLEETVLDIDITPNRGDCLSVLGVAREVAALTGRSLVRPRIAVREQGGPAAEAIAVRIDDPSGCRRYAARLVRGIAIGPSPAWLVHRLEAVGLRPINNVVDVTNLVMIERGQPLHAFDYDRLPAREIIVRRAGETRSIRTLDGVQRALAREDLLITTGADPVAVAGVMGGADSEVTETTTAVLLEAAHFDPSSVRRTARRLELRSEASFRFERGVDIGGVTAAIDRAASLLQQLAGGAVAPGIVESYPGKQTPPAIRLRPKRVGELLGSAVPRAEIRRALKSLGAVVNAAPEGALAVTPPTYRGDLTREIDLVEEIARVAGYDRFPTTMPAGALAGGTVPTRLLWERELRRLLVSAGFFEAVTLAFASTRANALFPGLNVRGEAVALANPINRDEPEMRRSLIPGLLAAWRTNRNQGARGLAAFTVGRVYWQEPEPREEWRVGGVLIGELPSHGLGQVRVAEFADAKGIVEAMLERLGAIEAVTWERYADPPYHAGKSAVVRSADAMAGIVGALHPEVEFELGLDTTAWTFELDMQILLPYAAQQRVFTGLPRFPAVARDVAIVVDDDFASDRVVRFVRQWQPELVEEVSLFDAYAGAPIPAGKKSLAYSIAYRAADRTLTDEEVNALQEELRSALIRDLGVALRQ
ncbi:MAG: phenylalanine--tRNA ligase subunit beta [Candidatus Binatia bacterium]